jgi:hypothetical protein
MDEFRFPEELRARAAFALLSASSLGRYVRAARELASDSEVTRRLSLNDVSTTALLVLAGRLLAALAVQAQRHEEEVDLALLLCIVSTSADPVVDGFLNQVGMSARPSLAWVSALSRALYTERASNVTTSLPVRMDMFVRSATSPAEGLLVRYPPNGLVFDAMLNPEQAEERLLRAA